MRTPLAATAASILIAGLVAPVILAGPSEREARGQQTLGYRPGWGFGAANRVHTGPPGRDARDERPGRGSGDAKHAHTGPPGHQSHGPPSHDMKHEREAE